MSLDTYVQCINSALKHEGEDLMKFPNQATEPAEAEVVGNLLSVWLYYRSSIFYRDVNGTCPHDPLTTAEALYPGN